MTYEEYLAEQQQLNNELVVALLILIGPFVTKALTRTEWQHLLALTFPIVTRARRSASRLARSYYDDLRIEVYGERHDTFLEGFELSWYEEHMEPAYKGLAKETSTKGDLLSFAAYAEKSVENAGRRTLMRAVKIDTRNVRWARVAGGEDSCAFCMMLISRGPVFGEADDAGLSADNVSAVELWKQIEHAETDGDLEQAEEYYNEFMVKWHPNCDCKAVPVFEGYIWPKSPGRDLKQEYRNAEALWAKVTKGYTGKGKLNALRRYLDDIEDEQGADVIPLRPAA